MALTYLGVNVGILIMPGKLKEKWKRGDHLLIFRNHFLLVPLLLIAGGCTLLWIFLTVSMSLDDRWGCALGTLLLLSSGSVFFEYEQFIFDGGNRDVSWKMYRLIQRRSPGVVPFDEIVDVTVELVAEGKSNNTYRIVLKCKNFDIPLANAGTPGKVIHERMREKIAAFVVDPEGEASRNKDRTV
jgi:hypothetical protein